MEIKSIKNDIKYLKEYVRLCSLEWGTPKTDEEINIYIDEKVSKILNGDKVISILGLIDNDKHLSYNHKGMFSSSFILTG